MGQYKCLRPKIPVIVAPCVENIFGGDIADFGGTPPPLNGKSFCQTKLNQVVFEGPPLFGD